MIINAMNVVPMEDVEGNMDLLIPHPPEIIWSLVAIVIVAIVMVKFALPKFNQILDERSERIESGLALAKKAKADSKKADEEAQRTIAEARQFASDIREEAQQEAKATIANATEEAKAEAARIVDNAHRQIEADRQAAQISLRTDVGLLAAELAEKIVGEQLKDRELSARVVDRFLDDLEAEKVQHGTKEA